MCQLARVNGLRVNLGHNCNFYNSGDFYDDTENFNETLALSLMASFARLGFEDQLDAIGLFNARRGAEQADIGFPPVGSAVPCLRSSEAIEAERREEAGVELHSEGGATAGRPGLPAPTRGLRLLGWLSSFGVRRAPDPPCPVKLPKGRGCPVPAGYPTHLRISPKKRNKWQDFMRRAKRHPSPTHVDLVANEARLPAVRQGGGWALGDIVSLLSSARRAKSALRRRGGRPGAPCPWVCAIRSHPALSDGGRPQGFAAGPRAVLLTVVRPPVDRILSEFLHEKQYSKSNASLGQWLQRPGWDNAHVRRFCGPPCALPVASEGLAPAEGVAGAASPPLTEAHLRAALHNLLQVPRAGRLGDSLLAARADLSSRPLRGCILPAP